MMLAKAFGTHWTQIYSANPGITSNPDALVVGQLVPPRTTLETTSGQMAPPKSGRVQECDLIQVAF